jgi:hypothetical protein
MANMLKAFAIAAAIFLPLGFYGAQFLQSQQSTLSQAPAIIAMPDNQTASVPTAPQPPPPDEMAALKEEMEHLKAEFVALRQAVQANSQVRTQAKQPDIHYEKATNHHFAADEQALRAEEERYFAKQGAALENDFRQQTVDPTWASEADTVVRNALTKDKISGNGIISLECRIRTCRVEVANNANKQAPKLTTFLSELAEELPNMMVSKTESSDATTVFYLSKEEFILPSN